MFTLFGAGSVIATLAMARFNDRPERHVLMIGGAALLAAALWLFADSDTFAMAGLSMALAGLSLSTVGTAPNAIITDLYPGRTGPALNALHISVGVGAFAGPLLIGFTGNYAVAYRLAAAGVAGVGLLWIVARPPAPVARRAAAGPARWNPDESRALAIVLLLALLYTGTEQIIAGWLYSYAIETGLAAAAAATATSFLWLAMLFGRVAAVPILAHIGELRFLAGCTILAMVGVGGMVAGSAVTALLWAGIAVTGLAFGPIFPTALALSGKLLPGRPGAAGSMVVAAGSTGAMTLPAAAGLLIPRAGARGSIMAAWLPLAAMLGCVWAAARVARRGKGASV
jgi:fucose permease